MIFLLKKIFLLVFLFIVFSPICYSQITIYGKVLDSVTRKPIPYCNVYFIRGLFGVLTDSTGSFQLNCPDWGGILMIQNTLYNDFGKILYENTNLENIYLLRKSFPQYASDCSKKANCIVYKGGISKKKSSHGAFYGEQAGSKIALHIENPCKENETAFVKSVFCYIVDPSDTGTLFQIQVYDATEFILYSLNVPLIPENIILRKPKQRGWLEIDVSKYNIPVPDKGIFVSVEILQDSPFATEKCLTGNKKMSERIKNTFAIPYSFYKNETRKYLTAPIGYRWLSPPSIPNTKIENPCIYAIFNICK